MYVDKAPITEHLIFLYQEVSIFFWLFEPREVAFRKQRTDNLRLVTGGRWRHPKSDTFSRLFQKPIGSDSFLLKKNLRGVKNKIKNSKMKDLFVS